MYIQEGRGGVYLRLAPEQYARLGRYSDASSVQPSTISTRNSTGKEAHYTLALWRGLTCFLNHPALELSSNLAENSMTPHRGWQKELDTHWQCTGRSEDRRHPLGGGELPPNQDPGTRLFRRSAAGTQQPLHPTPNSPHTRCLGPHNKIGLPHNPTYPSTVCLLVRLRSLSLTSGRAAEKDPFGMRNRM